MNQHQLSEESAAVRDGYCASTSLLHPLLVALMGSRHAGFMWGSRLTV